MDFFDILPQPDEATCGVMCQDAIGRYYQDAMSLQQLIREIPQPNNGVAQAMYLACLVLRWGHAPAVARQQNRIFCPFPSSTSHHRSAKSLKAYTSYDHTGERNLETSAYLNFTCPGRNVRVTERRGIAFDRLREAILSSVFANDAILPTYKPQG